MDEFSYSPFSPAGSFMPFPLHPSYPVPSEAQIAQALPPLQAVPKMLPPAHEDAQRMHQAIRALPECGLAKAEAAVWEAHLPSIAGACGDHVQFLDLGACAPQELLSALNAPAAYMPAHPDFGMLAAVTGRMQLTHPDMNVSPQAVDWLEPDAWETLIMHGDTRRIVYLPSSLIGCGMQEEAGQWLHRLYRMAGPWGAVLIGVDGEPLPELSLRAHKLCREFNIRRLESLRNDLDMEIFHWLFDHRLHHHAAASRTEAQIISTRDLRWTIGETAVHIAQGEILHTQHLQHYAPDDFRALAQHAGFTLAQHWADTQERFSLYLLETAA
jgi:uncharacterized SAM-dependent methyltransferase